MATGDLAAGSTRLHLAADALFDIHSLADHGDARVRPGGFFDAGVRVG